MAKKIPMPMNQWETMMAQAADRLKEYQDLIARVKRAESLAEVKEILNRH